MPPNDDNPRNHATNITEHDLLTIVEGTIDPARLRAIRDQLAEDKPLLNRLARMKQDRESLVNADQQLAAHTPPDLVHNAIDRAGATTLGFDALAQLDAPPAWPDEPGLHTMPDQAPPETPARRYRTSPTAEGAPRKLTWKGKTALAASILLVIAAAIVATAMIGALNSNQRPPARPSQEFILADEAQREGENSQALIDEHDAVLLQREQLADALAELIDPPGTQLPAIDDLDLDEVLRNTQSIDAMLAEIAEDMLDTTTWDQQIEPVAPRPTTVRPTTVRGIIDAGGIDAATIGSLARAGRLHVSLESRDPTQVAVKLLTPADPNAPRPDFAAELIALAEMSSAEWAAAAPIARSPATPGSETVGPPSPDRPGTESEAEAQLARVHQLLEQIRARQSTGEPARETTDPVYRIRMPALAALGNEAAGQAVIAALERIVLDGDRIAFYELSGASSTPAPAAGKPGFTMQMYVRARERR